MTTLDDDVCYRAAAADNMTHLAIMTPPQYLFGSDIIQVW